jgi:hypothetical protein
LLAWSEYRLPYDKDIDRRCQGRREYLVFLVLLPSVMVKYTKKKWKMAKLLIQSESKDNAHHYCHR